jgi:hypothetical protein
LNVNDLETRDDEVASASLLVQAMWKADGWQEGTLISTLTQVFQSAQNKASRSHQGYALSHVVALVPSDTLVERCCVHICSISQPGAGRGRVAQQTVHLLGAVTSHLSW